MGTNLIGTVAKCKHNIVGVIMDYMKNTDKTYMYFGRTLDNKEWQSKAPTVIAQSIQEYFNMLTCNKSERA